MSQTLSSFLGAFALRINGFASVGLKNSFRQTPVAVSESAVQTETATAPSSNLRDASAQTVRMANVDVQTDTIA